MAKLTTREQAILTGVTYPSADYSRSVSCVAWLKAPGSERGFTPPLGNRLWLRGVDVWPSMDYGGVVGAQISFRLLHGRGLPATAAEILTWTNILPVFWPDALGRPWTQYQPFHHQHWSMNQLFEGAGQRFGIWLEGSGFVPVLEFVATFEISEG